MEQQEIRFPGEDGRQMRGVLTLPDDVATPRPALVQIHEMIGIGEPMKAIAQRFAAHGYVVLMPDLFDRPGWKPICVLRTVLAMGKQNGASFRDLEMARQYLVGHALVDAARIGVVGFCMGGGYAVGQAATGKYRAAAPFYGHVPRQREALNGSCPVVGSWGGRDRIFRGFGKRLDGHLAALGIPRDVKTYPDAGHSFMTPGAGSALNRHWPMHIAYHEPSADDAWGRMLSFFDEYLIGRDAAS